MFLKKTLIETCSPHLYASFNTFCVQIGHFWRHSESLNILNNSEIETWTVYFGWICTLSSWKGLYSIFFANVTWFRVKLYKLKNTDSLWQTSLCIFPREEKCMVVSDQVLREFKRKIQPVFFNKQDCKFTNLAKYVSKALLGIWVDNKIKELFFSYCSWIFFWSFYP